MNRTNEDKKIVLSILLFFVFFVAIVNSFSGCGPKQHYIDNISNEVSDMGISIEEQYGNLYQTDGYENAEAWYKDLYQTKKDFKGSADNAYNQYQYYLSEEQKAFLYEYEDNIMQAKTITAINEYKTWFDQIVAIGEEARLAEEAWIQQNYNYNNYDYGYSSYSYDMPTSGLTKSGGVNYYDGRTETYYSSNVLYHYRTNEWSLDNEGFYRTDEGYYVVAASDMPQGTTFEGSKGTCIVLDSGCAAGVTDYYVGW